jgi:hypothetical protein
MTHRRHCEQSEAIQAAALRVDLDCVAAALLARTSEAFLRRGIDP